MTTPAFTTDQAIDRLTTYSKRLFESVQQAKNLYACFQSLNDNAGLRKRVNDSPANTAAGLMMNAVLRELILILVRVFDTPKDIDRSDKVSFPVISKWLQRDAIREELRSRTSFWFDDGGLAASNEAEALAAIDQIIAKVQHLEDETPNRNRRLRDFRDGFLAHELHREVPREPLLFGYIGEILEEASSLVEAVMLAIEGKSLGWETANRQVRKSADWLWNRVD